MRLFDILPQNLFSILSSKNKDIYVESLFVIRKAFKQEISITKTDLIAMLVADLDDKMLELDIAAEETEGNDLSSENKPGTSLSATAHYILRRLIQTHWVESEFPADSFDENITLPDYSIRIINVLYSLTDQSIKEYNSYVYATYSTLKTADAERDDFMYNALMTAYDNTVHLVDELKTLHNNIRRYHQALNEYATVNEVLQSHFDDFKSIIMDRIYHPLKTLDSVPRFRTPIIKILGGWLADHSIREKMCELALIRNKFPSREDAAEDIILKIAEVIDTYEKLDEMLEEIDRKNNAYTRASIEKMRYLLNSDRSIKGKIVELLKQLSVNSLMGSEKLLEQMSESVKLYKQGYLDEKSLYNRSSKDKRKDENPMELRQSNNTLEEAALAGFLDESRKRYNNTKVLNFVNRIMAEVDTVMSSEIELEDDDEFILLLLASLKNTDRDVFYHVDFLEGYIVNNGYRIPNMQFVRKEKSDVESAI